MTKPKVSKAQELRRKKEEREGGGKEKGEVIPSGDGSHGIKGEF